MSSNITDNKNEYILKGKKLQALLKENNITQMEFSDMLSINMSELSKMIHNKRTVPEHVLNNICELLQINPEQIINETKALKPSKHTLITDVNYKWNKQYLQTKLKEKNMTLADLCKIIKLHKTMFSSYNLGKSRPSIETVCKICKTINCSPEELINVDADKLNLAVGENLFEMSSENTNDSIVENKTEINTIHASLKADVINNDNDNDNNDTEEYDKPEYKHFEDQNVIVNMNIINENILTFINDFQVKYESVLNEINELKATNKDLLNKVEELQNKVLIPSSKMPDSKKDITSNQTISTIWENNRCTDKEMQNIVHSTITYDTNENYKKKIYKLIAYISRKKNLIFNQILHDAYNQFSSTYGANINELKKESKVSNSIDAIYNNALYKEIFFNMLCTNATTA